MRDEVQVKMKCSVIEECEMTETSIGNRNIDGGERGEQQNGGWRSLTGGVRGTILMEA